MIADGFNRQHRDPNAAANSSSPCAFHLHAGAAIPLEQPSPRLPVKHPDITGYNDILPAKNRPTFITDSLRARLQLAKELRVCSRRRTKPLGPIRTVIHNPVAKNDISHRQRLIQPPGNSTGYEQLHSRISFQAPPRTFSG